MDVDRNKTRRNLTPSQRDQYKREGKCFYCSQQGHISTNCPKKTIAATTSKSPASSQKQKKFVKKRKVETEEERQNTTEDEEVVEEVDHTAALRRALAAIPVDQRTNVLTTISEDFYTAQN